MCKGVIYINKMSEKKLRKKGRLMAITTLSGDL